MIIVLFYSKDSLSRIRRSLLFIKMLAFENVGQKRAIAADDHIVFG